MIIIGNNRERKFCWDARYNLGCNLTYSLNKKKKKNRHDLQFLREKFLII